MVSRDLEGCLGKGRKDDGFLLALSSLLEKKELWEQASLDCPLQGFIGTYLSITRRGGARLPSWGQGPGVWGRMPNVGMEKSLGSMVTNSVGRPQVRQKSNTLL